MRDVADLLERLGWSWYLTGSEALAAYAAPRQTLDTDVVVEATVDRLDELGRSLAPSYYFAEPLRVEKRWMASLVDSSGGGKVDLIVRDPDPWGREAMERRRLWEHPTWSRVWVSTLEDLLLAKLEWSEGSSELQLRDCRMLFEMNADSIDREYLEGWAHLLGVATLLAGIMRPDPDAT
jgi:hypothetical protein